MFFVSESWPRRSFAAASSATIVASGVVSVGTAGAVERIANERSSNEEPPIFIKIIGTVHPLFL